MRKLDWRWLAPTCFVAVGLLSLLGPNRAPARQDDADGPVAVEDDMHEFMEYVFQPAFLRLQAAMNADGEPDGPRWKAIKSDALILAESTNLLWLRGPDDHRDAWTALSREVRGHGGELYQAGKDREWNAARQAYASMVRRCNACHDEFADGEYQLDAFPADDSR